ncbi:MAG: molybdopterin-dependent oxidoreductase, partial [Geobacteraceae bacterium]|nr:molybdopterin-dependent oxidoreductase [Geobacteraceae bacterium]
MHSSNYIDLLLPGQVLSIRFGNRFFLSLLPEQLIKNTLNSSNKSIFSFINPGMKARPLADVDPETPKITVPDGEGAATNPFDDIYKTENIIVMGSNTTEAHPIVANRIIKAVRDKTATLSVLDVRQTQLAKFGEQLVIPYEANLLVLNMMA